MAPAFPSSVWPVWANPLWASSWQRPWTGPISDTDRLLECYYGRPLQQIFDTLGRETFLQAEEIIVAGLGSKRCVISTGGSVVYGAKAMAKLRTLGPVVFLSATLKTVRGRLDNIQDRGLAIAPGQSIDSLYHERIPPV